MTLFEGRDLLCVRGERRVFANLDFAVSPGGLLVLTGPNGSGKSSLLRVMAGLLRPAQGALYWDGAPVAEDPEAQAARLHYLGHLDAVKPVLTAAENLAFWAALHGQGAAEVARALAAFDLTALAEVPGGMLSAGQKRRVALARLRVAPAEIWLLDEPTVGLDTASLARLSAAIADHRATGGRVVAATHAPLEARDAETLDLGAFTVAPGQAHAAWGAGWESASEIGGEMGG
jgi:heme exporter protein A